jgi:cyclopropane fatty-acyl-phospholipid synthase-like methyltransferase
MKKTPPSAATATEGPAAAYPARTFYTPDKASQYQKRKASKDRAEMELVGRAFKLIPRGRVLDAPCGGGRVSLLLAKRGYQMTSADLSDSMIRIARESMRDAGLDIPVEQQDVERLTYGDRSFDAVVCFRLFHHFPNAEIRQRAVRELCRVADRFVAVSYFSPYSFTSVQRRLRALRGGRKSHKHQTTLNEVKGYFDQAGFRLVKNFARCQFIHTLHMAVFERK